MFCVNTGWELLTVNFNLSIQLLSFELCNCTPDSPGTISVPWFNDLTFASFLFSSKISISWIFAGGRALCLNHKFEICFLKKCSIIQSWSELLLEKGDFPVLFLPLPVGCWTQIQAMALQGAGGNIHLSKVTLLCLLELRTPGRKRETQNLLVLVRKCSVRCWMRVCVLVLCQEQCKQWQSGMKA